MIVAMLAAMAIFAFYFMLRIPLPGWFVVALALPVLALMAFGWAIGG